jgi:hypothetical protein
LAVSPYETMYQQHIILSGFSLSRRFRGRDQVELRSVTGWSQYVAIE